MGGCVGVCVWRGGGGGWGGLSIGLSSPVGKLLTTAFSTDID